MAAKHWSGKGGGGAPETGNRPADVRMKGNKPNTEVTELCWLSVHTCTLEWYFSDSETMAGLVAKAPHLGCSMIPLQPMSLEGILT